MTRVPLGDRHMALSLLLHLALQRATLSTLLTVITLLLQLWDSGRNQVCCIEFGGKMNNKEDNYNQYEINLPFIFIYVRCFSHNYDRIFYIYTSNYL